LSALSQKQYVLDVVFDDGSRLIRLSVKTSAVALSFSSTIGNFVPENGSQTVETHLTASSLDIGMQWQDVVSTLLLSRDTNVSNHATDTTAWDKHASAFTPYLIELR